MKSAHKSLVLLLSLTTMISACDVKHNLDEMHDSTVEMNKTTKDMSDTTSQMNKRTEGLESATGELYDALRQGDSLAARRAALDNMIKTDDAGRKISEAGKYFMSFEFQFWMNQGQDKGDEKREVLAAMGAREYFKDILEFIPDGEMTPKPFKGQIIATKKSNLVNCLNAMAVAGHMLNPKQEAVLKDNKDVKTLSMNSMIEDALLAKASIESGEKHLSDYPPFVLEVLSNEPIAIYIQEARYNYLAALFLAQSTNITHSKLTAVKYVAAHWSLDLSQFNTAQVEELNMFLMGALKTKALLKQIGVNPRTDVLLVRMLNNMTLMDISQKASISSDKIAAYKGIAAQLEELKKF